MRKQLAMTMIIVFQLLACTQSPDYIKSSVQRSTARLAPVSSFIKRDLVFDSTKFAGARPSETFRPETPSLSLATAIEKVVHDVEAWLPADIHAEAIAVYLESRANIAYPDGTLENTPLRQVSTF